ncbi:MAG: hypothetical protein RLP96_04230 [Alphaproteobacteria bacterium]
MPRIRARLLARAAIIPAVLLVAACSTTPPAHLATSVPANAAETQNRSFIALVKAADQASLGGDIATAITLYRQAHLLDGTAIYPLRRMADMLVDANALPDAVEAYRAAIRIDGRDVAARLGLGNTLLMLGQPALAVGHFEQALAVAPDDLAALNALAVTRDLLGEHAIAQERYRAILETWPDDRRTRINLALSLALSGVFDEALALAEPLAADPVAGPHERQNLALIYGLACNDGAAAALASQDLDSESVRRNLAFYALLRAMPVEQRLRALYTRPAQAAQLAR